MMKLSGIVLCLCFSPVATLFAQSEQVGLAKANDYGRLLVEAVNSIDTSLQRRYLRDIFSPAEITSRGEDAMLVLVQRLHADYHPLTFHHAEILVFQKKEGPSYIMHVYARKAGSLMYQDFQFYLDAAEPHQLARLAFIAEVSEPVSLPNGSITQTETLQWLDNYVERLRKEYDLSGSILIARGNWPVYEKYFGFEDLARQKPISERTMFNMASGGKMFTAIAIAQLAEAGKLQYDDPVVKYLPAFSASDPTGKVTIHHLLSHTSGIKEYWNGQNNQQVYTAGSVNEHLRLVYGLGFDFEPGKDYRYCNSNFILLGGIIEIVSGASFYDYAQRFVIQKALMKSAGYVDYGSPGTATPMARSDNAQLVWKEARHGIRGSSAGGSYSTTRDILTFSSALRENKLLSAESFSRLVSPRNTGLDPSDLYGYGFMISPYGMRNKMAYGHSGTADGVNFEYRYFPEEDITLILFSNQNNGAYDDLKKVSIRLITGER